MANLRYPSPCLFCLLLVGCAPTLAPATGDLRLDLQHDDPRIRIDATRAAVSESRIELAGILVANLSHADDAVRLFSSVALRKLTGHDFGYKPHGTPGEREAAIARWRKWLDRGRSGPAQPGHAPHSSAAAQPGGAP
jgi:hypothetical protein